MKWRYSNIDASLSLACCMHMILWHNAITFSSYSDSADNTELRPVLSRWGIRSRTLRIRTLMFQKPYYVSHFQDASDALKLVPTAV